MASRELASQLEDAVERNIERISEASRHIPKSLQAKHPEIPWRNIAGMGNILRHAYPIVDDSLVWEVVVRDLPPLKADCCNLKERRRDGVNAISADTSRKPV